MTSSDLPDRLLWLDLEMTGLDPFTDLILEVAIEVTDFEFSTIETYEARLKNSKNKVAERMQKNIWWNDFTANRDEFINMADNGKDSGSVIKEINELIERNFKDSPAILAGNSIHNDRAFIKAQWPEIDLKLHYRMLDVSSFKLLMQGKYGVVYEKKEVHRAFDDIQASIAELQYYLEWFSKNKSKS